MFQRRLIYTMVLLGSLVFFWSYREWLSGLLLTAVLLTPIVSFLLSLPGLLSCKISLRCPTHVSVGSQASIGVDVRCPLPAPLYRVRLRFTRSYTGERWKTVPGQAIPTGHCGQLLLQTRRIWLYDYLGLVRLPVLKQQKTTILVRPIPIKPEKVPDLNRFWSSANRPKSGGGYAENHELRLYRPGDNLRQIHWKLSAKTGKLIIREPMEAIRNAALLTLELRGTGPQLDRKLGHLLWMSRYLLEKGITHRICCHTGDGLKLLPVSDESQLEDALDQLLRSTLLAAASQVGYPKALWRFHIGGDDHAC